MSLVDQEIASVAEVCQILEVNRTSYYAWQASEPTVFEEQDAELAPLIRVIFKKHCRRYGARRIASELRDMGKACSAKKVSKVMKTLGLRAIQPKSFVPKTTQSNHRLGYSPNLLMDMSTLNKTNRAWAGDITYIPLVGEVYAYLAVLMDLFSRRIVGWKLQANMTESLVLAALRQALKQRQPPVRLLHHTDRGGQYAGNQYRQVLKRAKMRQSMSRPDNCYDNSFMESCFGKIKSELEMTEYNSTQQANKEIAKYIRYYNFDRKHSALEYLTPVQFEQFNNHST